MLIANSIAKVKKPTAQFIIKQRVFLTFVCAAALSLLVYFSLDFVSVSHQTSVLLCSQQQLNRSGSIAAVDSVNVITNDVLPAEPTVHRYDNGIIRVRSSKWQRHANQSQLATLNAAQLESLYENVLLELTAECSTNRRLGRRGDGGWNLCLVGPFKPMRPCFSFSFGINNIWEFDDEVGKRFNCFVFTFDPSMSVETHVRNEWVVFIREGLHAAKGTLDSWSVDSYLGFLKRFKAENDVIDILKIDIEHSEWPALKTAIKDGSLKNVKQLLLEMHIDRQSAEKDYLEYFSIIEGLYSLGFRLWHYNWNTFGTFVSRHDSTHRTCCHELYYINVNFLTGEVNGNESLARNPSNIPSIDVRTLLPISKTAAFDQLEALRTIDLRSQSETRIEELYFNLVEQQQIVCPFSRRLGESGDGGWDVCFSRPFDIAQSSPCVAFSFGINNMWKFDDQLAEQYACRVYMFDPSMTSTADHQRKQTSWFYQTGLGSENKVEPTNGWKMRTLCHLFEEMGYANKSIDVLKIDVEHWEWSSLERAIEEGCLGQVKQLLFEAHTGEMVNLSTDYGRLVRVWFGLYNLGFRTWKWHKNPTSIIYKSKSGAERACCYEHYMLNTKLIGL